MTENSTLFYIYDNTDSEENTELQGKMLEIELKELLKDENLPHFEVSSNITENVLAALK
jgi:hypothetical protein